MQPTISVIMSVFNGELFIARALLSLLAQTYDDFELILIDDGSSDQTEHIVAQINDARIIFVKQVNMGLTKSLNKALALAKGRWIARHDADDFSIHTRFARQIAYLDRNPMIGLLGSSCFIQPDKHGVVNEVYEYPAQYDDIVAAFPVYNPFVHGSMIINRELLEAQGGYNENYRYVQDYELWSRLLLKTKACNLETPLYVRSVHRKMSQVLVNKKPVFNEIRDNYMKNEKLFEKIVGVVHPIKSVSIYPVITLTNGWNKLLADSLYSMSCKARSYNLPWLSMWLQAKLYCPWRF
ncbi:MAG: glycosyltransferase [Pseudomonadota bacterium]